MKSLENISIRSLRKSGLKELTTQQTQSIFRTVYRITRNHEDAEDAMQDAFMRALRHSEDFAGRAAFSTWFLRIAVNSALMILRKRRNSRTVPWMYQPIPRRLACSRKQEIRHRMPSRAIYKKSEKQLSEQPSASCGRLSGVLLSFGS